MNQIVAVYLQENITFASADISSLLWKRSDTRCV